MKDSVNKHFLKYVSQNVLGMIGISAYILADTYFISKAVGADGITALNLALPLYSLIFAIGSMVGVGSDIRYRVAKSSGNSDKDKYFMNSMEWVTILGLIIFVTGLLFAENIVRLMGGDDRIVEVGSGYMRIFLCCNTFFMWNYVCNAFVRNDDNPSVAMAATVISSLFNILFDYILMFPLGMGINGAALATGLSPIVGILVCLFHFLSKKNSIVFKIVVPDIKRLGHSVAVGVSAFVSEISAGVITMVFNIIILGLTGNTGVAAYGVIANTAIVVISIFNGISLGSQPILSENYGLGNKDNIKRINYLGIITALISGVMLFIFGYFFADTITAVFNSEKNMEMAKLATPGIKLYYLGFIISGVNIFLISMFSAINEAKKAAVCSVLKGFVIITISAIILSKLYGMTGVWLAYPVSEIVLFIIIIIMLLADKKRKQVG